MSSGNVHPLDRLLADRARTAEVSELALQRWPISPKELACRDDLADTCVRMVSPTACCAAHMMSDIAAYFFAHGYQFAQTEAANAVQVDVPDSYEEENP